MITPLLEKNVKNYLLKIMQSQTFAHAYLFSGPEFTNKEQAAQYLAQAILCSTDSQKKNIPCGKCNHCNQLVQGVHPDLYIVEKEDANKNISVEQIKDLIRRLSLHSFIATYKVVIIYSAELLTEEAANALLKTLEEPSGKTVFILISKHQSFLPNTIVSRCQTLLFTYLTKQEFFDFAFSNKIQPDTADLYYRLSQGFPEIIEMNYKNKKYWQDNIEEVNLRLNIYSNNLVEKFNFVKKLLKNKKTTTSKNKTIDFETDIWLRILHDILFIKLNLENYIIFREQSATLNKLAKNLSIEKVLIQLNKILQTQKESVANTNIQLTLENLYLCF